jgi:hypothetical protein
MYSLRTALVEHPYRHQGHTGTWVVESKVETAAGQVAQGAALHIELHRARCKVLNGEALVCGHCSYLLEQGPSELNAYILFTLHVQKVEGLLAAHRPSSPRETLAVTYSELQLYMDT